MKTIRIAFVDFWGGFNRDRHSITLALKTKYNVEFVEPQNAQYVFFSVFGNKHWFLPKEVIKIFYTGENLCPDFNACDYGIGFERMDYGDRYFRFPNYYATPFFIPNVERMQQKHILNDDVDYYNRDFCSFVVSNSVGNPIRKEIFDVIGSYKTVDSGGRWLNNVGGPVKDKLEFEKRHKFSICFENSSHPGYTTEKIVEAFAAQTVPIYWGDPDVAKIFNPNSFINVNDYPDLQSVLNRVKELDLDRDAYMSMLKCPALLDEKYSFHVQFNELVSFLEHIVEQPIEKAQRYNRDFWGEKYLDREKGLIIQSQKSLKTLLAERIKDISIPFISKK